MARRFVWTPAKEQALQLEREGLTHAEIATRLGVSWRTVQGWTRRPDFRARRQALIDASWRDMLQRIKVKHMRDITGMFT